MSAKARTIFVEVNDTAYRKLTGEMRRRARLEGRGKDKSAMWKVIQDLLLTLPDPEPEPEEEEAPSHADR